MTLIEIGRWSCLGLYLVLEDLTIVSFAFLLFFDSFLIPCLDPLSRRQRDTWLDTQVNKIPAPRIGRPPRRLEYACPGRSVQILVLLSCIIRHRCCLGFTIHFFLICQ